MSRHTSRTKSCERAKVIHNDARLLGAELGMTVEVSAAGVIDREALGLGHIVQKRRPHKARRGRDAVTQRELPATVSTRAICT